MQIKLNSSKLSFKTDNKKLIQNLFDFNLGSFISEALDVSSSIEAIAFYFLYNVNQKTNVELSKQLGQEKINSAKDLVVISSEIQQEWQEYFETEIVINKEFFDNIIQHSPEYLVKSYKIFASYLKALNIEIPDDFYFEYYRLFRKNIAEEFQNNKSKYDALVAFFDNPVNDQNDTLNNQLEHYEEIKKHFVSPLQSGVEESKETLKDLYIEPNFKFFKNNVKRIYESPNDFNSPNDSINVHDFLNNYFLKGIEYSECRKNYNMIFVLGQPGQGKTSFCYKLVYDILEDSKGLPEIPMYFIKIRDLHAKDFINDTFNTINYSICQNVDFQKDKCLLVLDGLDEAYMSGGLTDQDLKNLYERLNKTARSNENLKIILTSRLNYLNIKDPSLEGTLVVKLDELDDEQVKLYVEKFDRFYPDNLLVKRIDEILINDDLKHIKELLQQAVLIYFIALSNIDIDKSDSKSIIYGKIFDSLAKRSWDNNGQLSYIKSDLREDPKKYSRFLRQYIRSIAFEVYQSPHLHISIKKLNELQSTKQFIYKCFSQDVSDDSGILKNIGKYLLISFYFQQSSKNHDDDTAIEFFHNSLWEFLTAEYIWEELKSFVLNVDQDGDLKQINVEEYFIFLKRLIGSKYFTSEIRLNLENIIISEDEDIRKKIIKQTEYVFYKLLEKDILLEYNYKTEILTAKEKTYSIFILMWTLFYKSTKNLDYCLVTNDNLNGLLFNNKSEFNFRYNFENVNFEGGDFDIANFIECFLNNVNLDFVFGYSVYLNHCIVQNSILSDLYGGSDCVIEENEFINITFKNIKITEYCRFIDNKIKNCKFINVEVPYNSWFNEFIELNVCDDDFFEKHRIFERISNEGTEMERIEIYVTSIE